VCTPKAEGGLGLRRAVDCNRAAMLRLIWDILKDRPSLWVRWSKAEILKNSSFWQVERKQSLSITKCLLDLRAQASANLIYSVGSVSSWSIWYDLWFQSTSLVTRLGYRVIYESGLSRNATLSEVISNSAWNWPAHVRHQCPFNCGHDEYLNHLFFECSFTKAVWSKVLKLNNCPVPTDWSWESTATWAMGRTKGSQFHSWMRRLGLAASIYHCWRERNNRV
ncbi:LOW QUALITY PROTEIN: zf-RVT domain-containing protein, partial [Cephalotus follicularis]